MGKKDITLQDFLGDPYIFADLFNGCCFGGEPVICPEELFPLDSVQCTQNNSGIPGKKIRDTKKLLYRGEPAAVLAVENQEYTDYRMAVRCMRYDADEYERQIKEIMSRHKAQEGISYFGEEDRILPVLTIVLYYGKEEWKRPRTIHDMLDFSRGRVFRVKIPDYPLQVLSVRNDINIELFRTELREVMGILQRVDDKAAMRRFFAENREAFSKMTERGFEVIVCSTNSRKLRRYIMKNTEGGHVNMCKAFDEWMEDCRMEGKALGIRIGEERGQKRGEKRGVKKGEARLSQLILKLGAEGRAADILRVAEDASLRNRLYRKYGL